MKQNRLKQFLCLLFFLLCLAPLAIFLLAGPSSAGANERLAAKPRLYIGTSVNWDVLSDAADYFAGRFGLRQELITADAAVRAASLSRVRRRRCPARHGRLALLCRHTRRFHRQQRHDGAAALVCRAAIISR